MRGLPPIGAIVTVADPGNALADGRPAKVVEYGHEPRFGPIVRVRVVLSNDSPVVLSLRPDQFIV